MRDLKDHAKMVISRSIERIDQIEETYEGSDDEFLVDLLADVMHWANARNISFNKVTGVANGHYENERKEIK